MPAFDANLMWRTTGDLTADQSCDPLTVYGGVGGRLAARVVVPDAFGVNDKVNVKVHASQDGSTYQQIAGHPKGGVATKGGAELIVPFDIPAGKNYVKVELDVTIASTTAGFGAVQAGIVSGVKFDYDRLSHMA